MPKTHDLGRLFGTSLRLSDDAPLVHTAISAEYDHGGRNCPKSVIIRTPMRRAGRWHGIRKSWLSVQIKLPTGDRHTKVSPKDGPSYLSENPRWGIVLGWWRNADDDGWSALARAVRLGRTDGLESVNYENPTRESIRRAVRATFGRRTAGPGDAGADDG